MFGKREKFSCFVFTFSGSFFVIATRFYMGCEAIREVVKANYLFLVS